MKVCVIITSFNEPQTVSKAVEQIICPNRELWPNLQLIITSPDDPTLKKAEETCQNYKFSNYRLLKDPARGKPVALNLAVETITKGNVGTSSDSLLILTDGDVYLEDAAIKNLLKTNIRGGVGGHPVSLDSRATRFGYYSHLFCEAAHVSRLKNPHQLPMSGYLYAIPGELLASLFPIPPQVRAEDAYISQKIGSLGHVVDYSSDALVYVKFPKTFTDWYKQKTRSLGGNVQIKHRTIIQDLAMTLFPLTYAKSPKEFIWSLGLYPLRLWLWLKIYYNHIFNKYKSGVWERIESSK